MPLDYLKCIKCAHHVLFKPLKLFSLLLAMTMVKSSKWGILLFLHVDILEMTVIKLNQTLMIIPLFILL